MPFDNPSAPVLDDNLLADISAGERVAKTWSLRQAGLFVVTMTGLFNALYMSLYLAR